MLQSSLAPSLRWNLQGSKDSMQLVMMTIDHCRQHFCFSVNRIEQTYCPRFFRKTHGSTGTGRPLRRAGRPVCVRKASRKSTDVKGQMNQNESDESLDRQRKNSQISYNPKNVTMDK